MNQQMDINHVVINSGSGITTGIDQLERDHRDDFGFWDATVLGVVKWSGAR